MVQEQFIKAINHISVFFFRIFTLMLVIALFGGCASEVDDDKKTFYESGEVEWTGKENKGIRYGDWIHFNQAGDTTDILTYKDNEIIIQRAFAYNKVIAIDSIRNGVKHGQSTTYDPEGRVSAFFTYKSGKRYGSVILFHKSGKMRKSYFHVNDSLKTNYRQFNDKGVLEFSMDSMPTGILTTYDSLGNKIVDVDIENGMILDTLRIY